MSYKNKNISFTSCDILFNEAIGNDGGGMHVKESNEDVLFLHSNVSYNRATGDKGGGIYAWKFNRNISFIETVFRYSFSDCSVVVWH